MAIKLARVRTFSRTITCGGTLSGTFTAVYNILTRTQLEEIQKAVPGDREYLGLILNRVEGFEPEGEGEAPYTADEQRQLVVEDIELSRLVVAEFNACYLEGKTGN